MDFIRRKVETKTAELLGKFPLLAVTGPRQSGKTTFCKMLRPEYKYANLEDLELRQFASQDPKGFLEAYQGGAILDEIQYVPQLFSYLQVATDAKGMPGEYILSGSQHFLLSENISQSLAGRVALFDLLPFAWSELENTQHLPHSWEEFVVQGGYPRQIIQGIAPADYFSSYVQTYVERDVRLIKNITNLGLFTRFMHVLAGRVGQLLNTNSMAIELGIDHKTVLSWLTVLEASFITFRLQPYFENFNKQVVKSPKVYFYDTGLLSYLLGIRNANDLSLHFAKGALFENLVILEFIKNQTFTGIQPSMYFWRDLSGHEIDLLWRNGPNLTAIEIKSGKTIQPDFFKNLKFFKNLNDSASSFVVYGGADHQSRTHATVLGFEHLNQIF